MAGNYHTVSCKLSERDYQRLKRKLGYKRMSAYQFLKLCCMSVDKITFVGHETTKQKFRVYAENIRLPNNWMKYSDAKLVTEVNKAMKRAER